MQPPSQGNGDDEEDTNAVVEPRDNNHRSEATPATISFPSWFVETSNECQVEEETRSDYHIWKHCADDNITRPRCNESTLLSKDDNRAATIAACFLKDYEDGRHPTLSPTFDFISDRQLQIYRFKHSWPWKVFGLSMASILLFAGTGQNQPWALSLQTLVVLLLGIDLY
jgi:hypothetical protein